MLTLSGTVNSGAVVSCMVIICVSELSLPQSSATTQVLVITRSPAQAPASSESV